MIKKIYVSEIPMIKNKDIEERIDDFVLQQKNGTLVVQDDEEKMMFYPRESTVAEMVEVLDLLPPDFHISVMGNDELAILIISRQGIRIGTLFRSTDFLLRATGSQLRSTCI